MNNLTDKMETMPIKELAFKNSIPMVISMISIALYGIIDTMFISKINKTALTAVSISIPIQTIITAVALGIAMGLNTFIAKTLGEKKEEKAKNAIKNGIILDIFFSILIIIIGILSLKSFISFFTKNKSIINLSYDYLIVLSIFSFISIFQILFEKILEAYGMSKYSMMMLFARCYN